MNIVKFEGLVEEKDGFTYTFFKLYQKWIMVMEKDKKILCTDVLTNEDLLERFQLDVSKYV